MLCYASIFVQMQILTLHSFIFLIVHHLDTSLYVDGYHGWQGGSQEVT